MQVRGTGGIEWVRVTATAFDNFGNRAPQDLPIDFLITAGPGGGEFLSPQSIETNFSGQASVNLTSGEKAGAVQVVARVYLATETLTSLPVPITLPFGRESRLKPSLVTITSLVSSLTGEAPSIKPIGRLEGKSFKL